MDVAYGLEFLTAAKLVVYTLGSLTYLFLMVLILGNRRLRRMEWLLFALMAALFMWYSGNLLALNVSYHYGAGPAVLSAFACTVSIVGFMAAVPLLVHVQAAYCAGVVPMGIGQRFLVACFYLPVIFSPWIVGRLLGHLSVEPMVALGPLVRWLVAWFVCALFFASAISVYVSLRQRLADRTLARIYGCFAGIQGFLGLGWAIAYLPHRLPPVGGTGGYFPTVLMLAGTFPGVLMGYAIFRHNFLDLRVQRNVVYSVAAIFGFLLYLDFMRRLSVGLEAHGVLPAAVTEGVMIFVLVVLVEPLKRLVSSALHQEFVSEFETVQKLASEIEECAKRSGDVDSLQVLVEERVPQALGFERVRLLLGPPPSDIPQDDMPQATARVSISRGGEAVGFLEVASTGNGPSGEQIAAVEILAGRLAGALELCQLIADKISLERELAAKENMAFLGEMAARIAHNVKNPLSGMKTIVQLMEEDTALPENARRDCRMLTDEIDRLNRNISQILRYAKPARDTDRSADLAAVVKRVTAISRLDAERRRITLDVTDSPPSLIEGGEEAASDIVSNLLVNALEASGEGGTIQIRLVRPPAKPQWVELWVDDQGCGIPEDKLEEIFQPFFTTRAAGTGLGLAIVKRRVDEIGGAVECHSPVAGENAASTRRGTRFVVRFRAARSPHSAGLTPAPVAESAEGLPQKGR